MDLQTSKIELTKLILNIDNPNLIEKIKDLLIRESSDFWLDLSELQRKELQLGIKQLKNFERISIDDFLKKVS